ncbi:hypothetical protein VNO80_18101 [Phaseolus coccineus]|uniref:Uncharacterized protein n=1 Tax=Phaseolus coccineus TaxID=3886 RepID=A0AAN9MH02_PHACN
MGLGSWASPLLWPNRLQRKGGRGSENGIGIDIGVGMPDVSRWGQGRKREGERAEKSEWPHPPTRPNPRF